MQHPFDQTAPTFAHYWAAANVKPERQREAMKTGERLLRDLAVYQELEAETGVKAIWTMCANERESGGTLTSYLGNGDPLHEITKHVPRHRGPFPTWSAGAKDAFSIDGISSVKVWSPARAGFEWVTWNGWGYGVASPYVLAATDLQTIGKFDDDGHYNAHLWDTQLGCIAIAWGILQHRPDLAFDGTDPVAEHPVTVAAPMTVGGSHHDTKWLQAALNYVARGDAV